MDQQHNKNWWQRLDPMTALFLLLLAFGILAVLVAALFPVSSDGREQHQFTFGASQAPRQ